MPTELSAEEYARMRAAMEIFEAPFVKQLRAICEEIGYGRVIQIAEYWMDEKRLGWLSSHYKVNCGHDHTEEADGR